MNCTSEKKTYPRFCAASPASAMRRRRVSLSASRKSFAARRLLRRSKEVDWAAVVEEVEVVEDIEKVFTVDEIESVGLLVLFDLILNDNSGGHSSDCRRPIGGVWWR